MVTRLLGYILILAALIVAGVVIYRGSRQAEVPLVFSPTQILAATWLSYKNSYVEKGTFRTVDKQRNNVTTSEGQSYTMLRAVWMGDKETFDGSWKWTQDNISHTGDKLFSWLWGKQQNGTYGVLVAQNGQNTATDADQGIALALVFAYARWQDQAYLTSARAILNDIWNKEVIVIHGVPYLAANSIEKTSLSPWAVVNPSYLSPAMYKVFAKVDGTHPWQQLADSSYTLLQQSMALTLDKETSANLPPNWIQIHKTTGAIAPIAGVNVDSNYGFDAMRVPFNLALDWQWFGDSRDKTVLSQMSYLSKEWEKKNALASVYAHDGSVVAAAEAAAVYAGDIGHFMLGNQAQAKKVYEEKLLYLYDPGQNTWRQPLSYYDDNWVWFGIALYNQLLPNLAADIKIKS
jgi:endo-1,4-beta-D-glucanase Y